MKLTKHITFPAAALALTLSAVSSQAQFTWIGANDGNWNDTVNWDPAQVPSGNWAQIKNGTTVVINSDVLSSPTEIFLGENSTINQTAGTFATSGGFGFKIGDGNGSGTYNLSGGTLNTGNDWFIVGAGPSPAGTGFFNVTGTGVANIKNGTGGIVLGQDTPTATGTMTIGGGGQVFANEVTTFGGPASGGTGFIILNSGGTLSLNNNISSNNGAITTTFNGGTLRATNGGNFINPNVTVVSTGGAILDTNGFGKFLDASVSGAGGLTKTGANSLETSADHTYVGNTVVNEGTFRLGEVGSLTFNIGSLSNTKITGNATGSLDLFGTFNFTLENPAATSGSWTIVDFAGFASPVNFGDNFAINGWTDAGGGLWTINNYTFSQGTGLLTAVPEPGTYAMVAVGLGTLLMFRRRRD